MSISRRGPVAVFRAVRRHPVLSAVSLAAAVVVLIGVGVVGGVAVAGGLHSASAAGAPSPTASAPTVDTAGFPTGTGIFTDTCTRTHTTADDPILMPGMTGQSMQHDFFGNRAVVASSTPAQLVGGATSCSTSADASAYWTPVLFQNGHALAPKSTLIYWRASSQQTASTVQPMPAGITLIAGDERATSPQGTRVVSWTCSGDVGRATASPHDCPSGHDLRLVITFPNCWDGHTLDGQHQTNVVSASSPGAACPASHPVRIPQIVFHANYPTSSAAGLTLSIGPTQTGSIDTEHADFMNGWNQSVLTADVRACTAADVRCGPVTGPEATPQGGKPEPARTAAPTPKKAHRTPAPMPSTTPMAGMS